MNIESYIAHRVSRSLHVNEKRDVRFVRSQIAQPRIATLSVVSLTLLLAACGDSPSDIEQMSTSLTATLADTSLVDAPHEGAVINIASGFRSAIRSAVEAHESYRAALSLEQEMMSRVDVAQSVRRLQITGNSTVGGMREQGGTQPDETTTGVAAGITISQLIYDGGESASNVNRATAEALGARAERTARGNDIALEAARAWIDVWQYEARLTLLRTRTAEMDTVVEQIERMASNGMIDRAALDSAKRQVVDITLEETRLQADLQQAHVRFVRFFNQQPTSLSRPAQIVSLADAQTQAKTWQQAPALQRSAAELVVAHSAVAGAQAAFKPRARLQAGVTSPMQDGESTDTSVGVMLEYTFGDGGRRRAQLLAAEARVEVVESQLTDAQRTLKAEMDAAVSQLAAIDRSMPLVEQQISLSASEAQTARSQLATGQSNLRQVIEAKIQNFRAEDRQISMGAEKLALQLTISSRIGALGQLIGLTSNVSE